MKLENQVASLELCKRLKELGVKQNAEFMWRSVFAHISQDEVRLLRAAEYGGYECDGFTRISAFTVAELGEMLPCYIHSLKSETPDIWFTVINGNDEFYVEAKTEADARAEALVFCLENKLVTP